jgi:hypothetical protein
LRAPLKPMFGITPLLTSGTDLTNTPYLVPVLLIALWLFISAFNAVVSGWWLLALNFRATEKPDGQMVTGQVKQMGFVPENRVTHMIISPVGLYLYASLLFRFLHPALLIPWSSVQHARKIKRLWWTTYKFDLESITSIRVTQKAYDAIRQYKS